LTYPFLNFRVESDSEIKELKCIGRNLFQHFCVR